MREKFSSYESLRSLSERATDTKLKTVTVFDSVAGEAFMGLEWIDVVDVHAEGNALIVTLGNGFQFIFNMEATP